MMIKVQRRPGARAGPAQIRTAPSGADAEVAAGNQKISDLGGEQGAKAAQNVAAELRFADRDWTDAARQVRIRKNALELIRPPGRLRAPPRARLAGRMTSRRNS